MIECNPREKELRRLLVLACRVLERRADVPMPADVGAWWRDNRSAEYPGEGRGIGRADAEVIRQRALDKLTLAERTILGV